jgi:hypothetical protein
MTEDGAGSQNRHRWRVTLSDVRIVKSLFFFCRRAVVRRELSFPGVDGLSVRQP